MMYTESNSEDTGTSPENVVGLRSERPVSKRYQTTSSAAFSRSFETQLLWLERLYVLDEKEEVLQFLRTYPFLVPLLRDVYSRIETYFPDSLVFLEVTTNPEHLDRDQVVGRIAVVYPWLRVEIEKVEIEGSRSLPPLLFRPMSIEALALQKDGHLSSSLTAKATGLPKFAPQLALGSL